MAASPLARRAPPAARGMASPPDGGSSKRSALIAHLAGGKDSGAWGGREAGGSAQPAEAGPGGCALPSLGVARPARPATLFTAPAKEERGSGLVHVVAGRAPDDVVRGIRRSPDIDQGERVAACGRRNAVVRGDPDRVPAIAASRPSGLAKFGMAGQAEARHVIERGRSRGSRRTTWHPQGEAGAIGMSRVACEAVESLQGRSAARRLDSVGDAACMPGDGAIEAQDAIPRRQSVGTGPAVARQADVRSWARHGEPSTIGRGRSRGGVAIAAPPVRGPARRPGRAGRDRGEPGRQERQDGRGEAPAGTPGRIFQGDDPSQGNLGARGGGDHRRFGNREGQNTRLRSCYRTRSPSRRRWRRLPPQLRPIHGVRACGLQR